MALLPVRWQTSRVTSGVNRSPAGRPISFNVSFTLRSETRSRKGDCSSWTESPCFKRVVETAVAGRVDQSRRGRWCLCRSVAWFDASDSKVTPATSSATSRTGNANFQSFCRKPPALWQGS